jgi:hypothetical protein
MQILKRITSISASGRKKKDHISALQCGSVEVIGDESDQNTLLNLQGSFCSCCCDIYKIGWNILFLDNIRLQRYVN